MTTSTDISGRFWNLPQKADEETERENLFIDDIVQKAHIEREILSGLSGVRTVFDGGAGYGRFSIPLAKRGLRVTHFDISQGMLDKARELAARESVLENMTFVLGSLEELGRFEDGAFDLVLSFDAPVSYTYPEHETVIGNLLRIASRRLVLGVYSRLAWTYQFDPAQKYKYILDESADNSIIRWTMDRGLGMLPKFRPDMAEVRRFFSTGLMESPEETARAFDGGGTPWPVSYAFMPDELVSILKRYGAGEVRLAGPGALSRSIPREVLGNVMRDEALRVEFLDFCYWYDSQPWCVGMGKDNILATVELQPRTENP